MLNEKRDNQVTFLATEWERKQYDKAARDNGMTLSAWIRFVLLNKLKEKP